MRNKILILVLLLGLLGVNIYAEEGEESKMPVDFSFEFETLFGNSNSHFSGLNGLSLEPTISGSLSIPFDFYTLTFWSEDEFEIGWDGDLSTSAPDYLSNDLEVAIDNTFSIPNALEITIGYDQEITWAPKTPIFLGFAPHLVLAGEYDFGLSWYIDNYFIVGYAAGYSGFNWDAEIAIEYEYFHFFAPEGISGSLYADNDTFGISTADQIVYSDIEVGFNFDIYGVAPYVHFTTAPSISYVSGMGSIPVGIATGLSYSKSVFSFGVDYTGTIDVFNNGSEFEHLVEAWLAVGI